jgi:hypothetical protein
MIESPCEYQFHHAGHHRGCQGGDQRVDPEPGHHQPVQQADQRAQPDPEPDPGPQREVPVRERGGREHRGRAFTEPTDRSNWPQISGTIEPNAITASTAWLITTASLRLYRRLPGPP